MRNTLLFALIIAVTSLTTVSARAQEKKELWLYYPTNLLVKENIDKLDATWTKAAKLGYTHVLLADSKFSRLGDMDQRYFDHVTRVKQIAKDHHLTIVPAVFPVGYSNDLLFADPNLAEGLPVRDQPFLVRGGRAVPVEDAAVNLSKLQFKDDVVNVEGNVATVGETDRNARMNFSLAVKPFRSYHVSVRVKTDNYTGQPEIKALAPDGTSLQWQNLGAKRTQDWTGHHVVFNSLGHDKLNLYFGVWGGGKGRLQWRDWHIEEAPLVNLLRRPGAPLVVKIDGDGGRELVEGTDFEPPTDPLMGSKPYPGNYTAWHEPPTLRTKGLPDGTRLLVSWYHPAIIYDEQVSCCVSEPKTMELLADQAKRMKETWGAAGYMMSHDEIRTLNQDEACRARNLTAGQLLADNARRCRDLLKPATAYVWNDMFDPYHNAVTGPYYLVRGAYTGSWQGLDKDVVIVNWNHGQRDRSLKFFADRGHQQIIAGYYDNDLKDMRQWLDSAKNVKGVAGYMYTTWRNDYGQIEAFAKLCQESTPRAGDN
jgi:hypothetical protein